MPCFQKPAARAIDLPAVGRQAAREDNDFIMEFSMTRFIDLAIVFLARCTPSAK
jgi:hypothetical protein